MVAERHGAAPSSSVVLSSSARVGPAHDGPPERHGSTALMPRDPKVRVNLGEQPHVAAPALHKAEVLRPLAQGFRGGGLPAPGRPARPRAS